MRTFRRITLGIVMASIFWLVGLTWFSFDALRTPSMPPRCDGIVALTGGQDRIETSLLLFQRNYAKRLLISGVGAHASLPQLLERAFPKLPDDLMSRVTLGHRAVTTIGNGAETAEWARQYGIHTLIVVTAGYHIRRAMTEIRRADPSLQLFPYPVRPPALQHPFNRTTLALLAREYDKWLGSKLGLSRGVGLAPVA